MTKSNPPADEGPPSNLHETIQAEFDWAEIPPSTAVVETVAIAANQDPMELEPLYETIDPDALDMVIRSMKTNTPDEEGSVTFPYDGHEIMVHRDGTVVVRPVSSDAPSEQ